MAQLQIPDIMLLKHPEWTKAEMRTIIKTILNSKTSKLKSSHIIRFVIPGLGEVKSHGNKKHRRHKSELIKDRKKKKAKYNKLLMTKEKLLW